MGFVPFSTCGQPPRPKACLCRSKALVSVFQLVSLDLSPLPRTRLRFALGVLEDETMLLLDECRVCLPCRPRKPWSVAVIFPVPRGCSELPLLQPRHRGEYPSSVQTQPLEKLGNDLVFPGKHF